MNYKLAYKAELIASKIKKKLGSSLPAMMFHDDAYHAIRNGLEKDFLTDDELKKCDEISEEAAQKFIESLP